MTKNSGTKKSLKASGLSLVLCIAMLIGTTFAWFTDSITNKGNVIQSGNLDIGATAYGIGTGGVNVTIPGVNDGKAFTFEATGADLETSNDPIINDSLWEPGKSNAKLLQVSNKGNLAAKVKLDFDVKDNGLEGALWFDFVQIKDGKVVGNFEKRPMSQLKKVANAVEVKLQANENVQFVLVYGMDEKAENTYQNKTFKANVTINATQLNSEKDGFENPDYDKEAQYDGYASNQEEFKSAMENAQPGDTIAVTKDFTLEHVGEHPDGTLDNYLVTKDVTVDLRDYTVTVAKGGQQDAFAIAASGIKLEHGTLNIGDSKTTYSLFVTNGAKNVVIEDVTINGGMQVIGNSEVTLKNVVVNATNYYDVYLEYKSTVTVESGTFNNKDGMPHFYTAMSSDKVIVNGGTFKGGTPTHKGNGQFINNIK